MLVQLQPAAPIHKEHQMQPSSNGSGHSPPQVENVGSTPAGCAIPDYDMINACPWSGVACTCDKFPWLEAGALLPKVCSDLIRDKMQAMEPFRKLTKKG
jgi:hypothetical protein